MSGNQVRVPPSPRGDSVRAREDRGADVASSEVVHHRLAPPGTPAAARAHRHLLAMHRVREVDAVHPVGQAPR
eukprot:scaffold138297_cov31-Tisochrysis_lutea.AAC.1